ncbi:MAG: glycosyltransferase family 4 protein [Patescibacteria group bacterium]|nr:glycosyltransferase family 4 protein [Patescibacteria group bacterium]
MKIAFIGQKGIPAETGGVERHVEFLAIELTALGHEVIVYNRRHYTKTVLKEFEGVKLIYKNFIDNKNLANITHTFLASIDVIFRKADIIHYHGVGPSLLLWIPKIFSPKSKLVATLHSFDYDNEKWGKFAKTMLRLGERIMFALADEVIVITPVTQAYVFNKYGRRGVLIANGTKLSPVQTDESLKLFGLEKDSYIFSASRLIKLKGIQYLIKAYNNLTTDKKLVIAGDGEYKLELEKLAIGNSNIIFLGNQGGDILRQLYANAYLFVQSSEMEGLSLSLLEAMGHKTASLASDIEANKEALADTGMYFHNSDELDLARQLTYALANPELIESMASAAYKRACEKYDWKKIAVQTADTYHILLK